MKSAHYLIHKMQENWPEKYQKEVDVITRLYQISRCLQDENRKILDTYALAPLEFELLFCLRIAGGSYKLTPSELNDYLLITSGGLSKMIQRLIKKGYIRKQPNSNDHRSYLIQLTPEGHKEINAVAPHVFLAENEPLKQALDDQKQQQLISLLDEWLNKIYKT